MSHPIHVPDDLYAEIRDYARQHGNDLEAIITAWLKQAVEHATNTAPDEPQLSDQANRDPLAALAGIVNIPDAEAGDSHDAYFGSDGSHDNV